MSLVASNNWDTIDLDINNMFDDFVKDLKLARRGNASHPYRIPALEVHETDKEYIVSAELPGLSKEQINADVRDNVLIISGEVKKDQKFHEGKTLVQERRYGNFSRSLSLPPNINTEEVKAKYENGVLELNLPKSAPSGKKISIN